MASFTSIRYKQPRGKRLVTRANVLKSNYSIRHAQTYLNPHPLPRAGRSAAGPQISITFPIVGSRAFFQKCLAKRVQYHDYSSANHIAPVLSTR